MSRRSARRTAGFGVAGALFTALLAHVAACGQKYGAAPDAVDAAASTSDDAADGPLGASDAADAGAEADADDAAVDAACGHLFCADFEGTSAKAGWDGAFLNNGSSLAIAAGQGKPGNALQSSIPMDVAGNDFAYVTKTIAGEQALHVELEMNLPSVPASSATVLTILQVSGMVNGNVTGVAVLLRSMSPQVGTFIFYGDSTSLETWSFDIPHDAWTHGALDIRFGAAGVAMVKLVIGDAPPAVQAHAIALPPAVEVRVGVAQYSGKTSAYSALFDTVRVDPLQ